LRIVTGCLRPTPADNLPILAAIQPSELSRKGATLSLARHAMEPGHLLHSALTWIAFISSPDNNIRRALWAYHRWDVEWLDNTTRLGIFVSDTGTHPPGMTLPRTAWVQLNRLRTGVGRFRSCLSKWGTASSAACEFGAEEQTVDHIVLQCPIHRSPHGLYGLAFLNVETIEWLLNTCPEI